MIMWENESSKCIKGQIEIHRHIPLISLYFEFVIVYEQIYELVTHSMKLEILRWLGT